MHIGVVHDFVPVVRESDEVTGFYDLITDARLALDGRALSIGVNSIVIRNADF